MERDALAVMPEAGPQVTVSATGPLAEPEKKGAFRALGSRPFRLYFAGQVVSASGTFLQQTAIGWLVLKLTGSASSLGLVLAAGGLPSLILGPWGGIVADRVDLRKLLIVTETTYGVLAAALWAVAVTGRATVSLVVTINVLSGFVQIVDSPARQAFVSRLVAPGDLPSAVSLNGVVVNSAKVVGPAVAGILIATVGTTPCFGVNALSYLAVVGALVVIRPLGAQVRRSSRKDGGVRAGLRYAAGRQQLWLPLLMMSVVGLLSFNFGVVLPVLAKDTFHGTGGTYGLLSAMLSVGSVVGSLAIGLIRHPRKKYLVASALAFGAFLAATAESPSVSVACVALVATGIAAFAFVTLASTALQLHSSSEYRGRVMALWVFVYIGTTPIGSVVTGWITAAGGPRSALLVGGGACIVVAGLAGFLRIPPVRRGSLTDLTS